MQHVADGTQQQEDKVAQGTKDGDEDVDKQQVPSERKGAGPGHGCGSDGISVQALMVCFGLYFDE